MFLKLRSTGHPWTGRQSRSRDVPPLSVAAGVDYPFSDMVGMECLSPQTTKTSVFVEVSSFFSFLRFDHD